MLPEMANAVSPALDDEESSRLYSQVGTVCAVVVTYNRRHLLEKCLQAILGQTRPPEQILVVDNASSDGTGEMLRSTFPSVSVLTLPRNVGGSGGFHQGMKAAFAQGYDWLWLMDDDGVPAEECLETLLSAADGKCAVVPIQESSTGARYGVGHWKGMDVNATAEVLKDDAPKSGDYVFAFVGPLISRDLVESVGLPIEEFFIWFDDIEYALRIIRNPDSKIVVVPQARFFHEFGGSTKEVRLMGRKSIRPNQPAWKSYYNARNPLYIVTRLQPSVKNLLYYGRCQIRAMAGELLYEPDRFERIRFRLKGIRDGVLGRLGNRH